MRPTDLLLPETSKVNKEDYDRNGDDNDDEYGGPWWWCARSWMETLIQTKGTHYLSWWIIMNDSCKNESSHGSMLRLGTKHIQEYTSQKKQPVI